MAETLNYHLIEICRNGHRHHGRFRSFPDAMLFWSFETGYRLTDVIAKDKAMNEKYAAADAAMKTATQFETSRCLDCGAVDVSADGVHRMHYPGTKVVVDEGDGARLCQCELDDPENPGRWEPCRWPDGVAG